MKWSIEKRIYVATGIALAVLIVNALVSFAATRGLLTSQASVAHTNQVIAQLETILSTVKDAETGQRGYLITGELAYLEPYQSAVRRLDGQVDAAKTLIADSAFQQSNLQQLQQHLQARLQLLKHGVDLTSARDTEAARQVILSGSGRREMDEIRRWVGTMENEERRLLTARDRGLRTSARDAFLTITIANLSACVLVIVLAYLILRDMTARQKAERLLADQREWLAVTLASIGDGVIAADARGHITLMNPVAQALTGWREDEAVGQPLEQVFAIVDPETREKVSNPAIRAFREGRIIGLENHTVLIGKTGGEIPIDDSGAPITDARGNVRGAVLVFRDITERSKVEQERARLLAAERDARHSAEAASRAKDEFVAMISHELRAPLNAILGWAQMMRKPNFPAEEAGRAAESIERNARAQARLIEDLLDVSRIITGKLTLEIRPVDILKIAEAALETVRPAAEAKSIYIDLHVAAHGTFVSGDANRLQQVFWNLLSNAVKFTPKDGRITVDVQRIASHIELAIRDTGAGIAAGFLPFVFDRFSQANSSSERRHGGLGLGLAIVRHLVELHGGTVRAESAGEAQGATFTVALPVRAVLDDVQTSVPPGASLAYDALLEDPGLLGGLRVLVVDDEAETRELLSVMLRQRGAEVVTAASASEAFPHIEQWRPSVIVSDIGMPEEDGYAFIQRVRALDDARGGRIPAVALTAFARSQDRMRALMAGFQMHVPKPVEAAELVMVIASLAQRPARDDSSQDVPHGSDLQCTPRPISTASEAK